MTVRILIGDVREKLAELPAESVHCVVTSPPYWGQRDYGVKGQIGLEETPDEYIETMVAVFREARRVLRADGTLWLNLGDSYAGSWGAQGHRVTDSDNPSWHGSQINNHPKRASHIGTIRQAGLKPKDLCMMPARLALALQADGWWLRSEIVWAKPNPMPESVTDRPTSAHEKVFLLTKSARYFYDAEAVREAGAESTIERWGDNPTRKRPNGSPTQTFIPGGNTCGINPAGRNLRNVWNIATQPYLDAHFATFPTALVEPCIKAGTSEKGCCPECGAPWVRETLSTKEPRGDSFGVKDVGKHDHGQAGSPYMQTVKTETIGWRSQCLCPRCGGGDKQPTPCTVLDPFAGSGTTGLVADRLGRDAILIELSPDYAEMARKRIQGDAALFSEVALEGG